MKLYSDETVELKTSKPETPCDLNTLDNFDNDLSSLDEHMVAYESLTTVYDQVSAESFNFIDKKNYTLFNEYIKVVTLNLDVKNPPVVSLEAIEILPTAALNHHLALEGFIGTMWDKVKTLFKKIYDSVKQFFTNHFTKLGRLKKKLANLKEVLGETDKDLKQVSLETVPSSLVSKFPYSGTINEDTIAKSAEVTKLILSVLEVTNKEAIDLASRDILSKDFVAKVKSLKEKIADIGNKVDENNEGKVTGLAKFGKDGRTVNKAIKEDNKNLESLKKEASSELEDEKGKLGEVVSNKDNMDATLDDREFEVAKKEMTNYIKRVEESFGKLVNKPITGGKILKEVKVTKDDGIELSFDTEKDTPSDVSLGSKTSLVKMIDTVIGTLDSMEKVTNNYTKVNDVIMKNLDTVDKLVNDLDKVTGANEAAYKKILQNKVRERLKMMQTFFSTYNKINKGLMGMVTDIGDGVVAYTIVSLKHFG